MILEAIGLLIFNAINFLLNLFPVTVIFGGILPDFGAMVSLINSVSCIMPVGSFAAALGVWLVLANIDLLISVINWVIKKIPGVE
jgi:hypothetical protein